MSPARLRPAPAPAQGAPDQVALELSGTLLLGLADAARAAVQRFVAVEVWDKAEIEKWLLDSYQPACVRAHGAVEPAPPGDAPMGSTSNQQAEHMRLIALAAKASLGVAIEQCAAGGPPAFVRRLQDRGLVRAAFDVMTSGYVAVDVDRATFGDRVMSMLAADFLTRPSDYNGDLSAPSHPISTIPPNSGTRERRDR